MARARADGVDNLIRLQMERQHIPGLSLAVVQQGHVVKARGYGRANEELNVPAMPETVYQIQSMTKSFTATAVMMLVEEGKIRLDDPVSRYLEGTPESWRSITVRHLLTHTSGIKDFINEPTASLRLDVREEEVLRTTAPRPLNFPPGERYAYSNTNYHLLGMILHKLTGLPYGEVLRRRILEPLGMRDTRVISLAEVVPNRASGYLWQDGRLRNGEYIAASILGYAGGGLRSTVLDLARWDAALGTERLLKRSSLEQMWTPATLNDGSKSGYGFGWAVGELRGHRYVNHAGGHMTGFTTIMIRYPDDGLTVIVLTNQSGTSSPGAIAQAVARRYLPALKPPRRRAVRMDPARYAPYTGRYELRPNFMQTITAREGRLYAQDAERGFLEIRPEGEDRFFYPEVDAQIRFERDARGGVVALRFRNSRGELRAPRIGPLVADLPRQPDPDPARTERVRLEFLACEEGADRGIERYGGQVARVCYYRLGASPPLYLLVYLTADGLFTDLDVVEE